MIGDTADDLRARGRRFIGKTTFMGVRRWDHEHHRPDYVLAEIQGRDHTYRVLLMDGEWSCLQRPRNGDTPQPCPMFPCGHLAHVQGETNHPITTAD